MEFSNRYAPEHLIINAQDAESWLPLVDNAGSVFLGPWTPESAGDYASGTNHVLPTYGYGALPRPLERQQHVAAGGGSSPPRQSLTLCGSTLPLCLAAWPQCWQSHLQCTRPSSRVCMQCPGLILCCYIVEISAPVFLSFCIRPRC